MFIIIRASYLDYIDVAEVDNKSYPCTHSARLKGIDHGYLHRTYEEYCT
jgi:hypothetical protein